MRVRACACTLHSLHAAQPASVHMLHSMPLEQMRTQCKVLPPVQLQAPATTKDLLKGPLSALAYCTVSIAMTFINKYSLQVRV